MSNVQVASTCRLYWLIFITHFKLTTMINLLKLKPILLVISVPILLVMAFEIANNGGWVQLWNFIFGYLVGALYAWLNTRK